MRRGQPQGRRDPQGNQGYQGQAGRQVMNMNQNGDMPGDMQQGEEFGAAPQPPRKAQPMRPGQQSQRQAQPMRPGQQSQRQAQPMRPGQQSQRQAQPMRPGQQLQRQAQPMRPGQQPQRQAQPMRPGQQPPNRGGIVRRGPQIRHQAQPMRPGRPGQQLPNQGGRTPYGQNRVRMPGQPIQADQVRPVFRGQANRSPGQGMVWANQGRGYAQPEYDQTNQNGEAQTWSTGAEELEEQTDTQAQSRNPWSTEGSDDISGIWDTITNWVNPSMDTPTAKGAALATSAASGAKVSGYDNFLNNATKGIGAGLVIANGVFDIKAKAKGARYAAAQTGFDNGALTADEAFKASKGDVDNRPWTEKETIIKGVSNVWIVGGSAAALALILIMKKRNG